MDKNPSDNAGEMGSIPDLGRWHIIWSNKAHATRLKPMHPEPVLRNKRSLLNAVKHSPCSPQLEKA